MDWWKNSSDDERQEYVLFFLLGLIGLGFASWASWRHFHPKYQAPMRAAAPAIPTPQARIRADFEPHKVRLTGVVDSEASRTKLVDAAKSAFPKSVVEDQLLLSTTVQSPSWLGACGDVIRGAHEVRWGHLLCSQESIALTGDVTSEEAKASTLKLVSEVHGGKVEPAVLHVTAAPKVDPDALKADLTKHLEGKIVEFETGSENLTAKGRTVLDELVPLLKELDGLKIEVGGHTDNVGDAAKNTTLSENRAQSVIAYLGKKGVDTTHLSAKGYGDTKPKVPNDTPEGQQKNRRIEFDATEVHAP